MTTEDTSQMPLFSPEDEKVAQKELKRLRKNENGVFKVNHKRTGFEDKTLWDKLNLFGTLSIPIVVALATIAFGLLQIHLSDVAHQQDQQSALDQQRATILQTYIDNIQDLLLNHNLFKSNPFNSDNLYYDTAIVARARTLTALQGLDPKRRGLLVQFICGARLIGFMDSMEKLHDPIIDLTKADLSGADLHEAGLFGANLSFTDLHGADLSSAFIGGADLHGADLHVADLSHAFLGVKFFFTTLPQATLAYANLTHADLEGADLSDANLTHANFNRAVLSGADLSVAQNLTQQ